VTDSLTSPRPESPDGTTVPSGPNSPIRRFRNRGTMNSWTEIPRLSPTWSVFAHREFIMQLSSSWLRPQSAPTIMHEPVLQPHDLSLLDLHTLARFWSAFESRSKLPRERHFSL
jgi:hypothetical protein